MNQPSSRVCTRMSDVHADTTATMSMETEPTHRKSEHAYRCSAIKRINQRVRFSRFALLPLHGEEQELLPTEGADLRRPSSFIEPPSLYTHTQSDVSSSDAGAPESVGSLRLRHGCVLWPRTPIGMTSFRYQFAGTRRRGSFGTSDAAAGKLGGQTKVTRCQEFGPGDLAGSPPPRDDLRSSVC